MRTVVIYPGRFHPFHRGHKASYDHLVRQFGEGNVYIVSSNKQAPLTSPFSFDDKMTMMTRLGVPPGRIAQVKNPYQAHEITKEIEDPENTVLIFAVSEKDMAPVSAENPDGPRFNFVKKDGSPGYIQPLPTDKKQIKPMTQNAYVAVTPTVNFRVRGADANSASQIRKEYVKGNDNDREQIIADLYGEMDPEIKAMFDRNLGVGQQLQNIIKEAREHNPSRALDLLKQIQILERRAQDTADSEELVEFLPAVGAAVGRALVGAEAGAITRGIAGAAGHEIGSDIEDMLDDDSDYIEEKWSQRYKRSINCSNPQGFSQKAHCAGRKK
jgi:hypothetical protein